MRNEEGIDEMKVATKLSLNSYDTELILSCDFWHSPFHSRF